MGESVQPWDSREDPLNLVVRVIDAVPTEDLPKYLEERAALAENAAAVDPRPAPAEQEQDI